MKRCPSNRKELAAERSAPSPKALDRAALESLWMKNDGVAIQSPESQVSEEFAVSVHYRWKASLAVTSIQLMLSKTQLQSWRIR